MPIGLASGGSNKLAAILLSIAVMEGGLVIVDEIENGLYYRRIPDIWRAIIKFAAEYNCQIFASSHSSECIRSLAEIAAESPDEYCMLRTVSSPTGTIVRYFRGQEFSDSILSDVEMR